MKNRLLLALGICTALCATAPVAAYAQEQTTDIWRVNNTDTQEIDKHGTCQNVTNSMAGGEDIMVPVATSGEWSAFRSNLPTGVTLGACGPTPVAHWMLDETGGVVIADDAQGLQDGGMQNGLSGLDSVTGQVGTAIQFDGADDVINLLFLDITTGTGLTIATWFNSDNFSACGGECVLIAKASGATSANAYWDLRFNGGNTLQTNLRIGGTVYTVTSSERTWSTATWYHAAVTYDGSNIKLYVDGVEVGTSAQTGTLSTSGTTTTFMGAVSSPGSDNNLDKHFDGAIDDMRIYDQGLTAAEIATLAGVSPPTEQFVENFESYTIDGNCEVPAGWSTSGLDCAGSSNMKIDTGWSLDSSNSTYHTAAFFGDVGCVSRVETVTAAQDITFDYLNGGGAAGTFEVILYNDSTSAELSRHSGSCNSCSGSYSGSVDASAFTGDLRIDICPSISLGSGTRIDNLVIN